VRLRCGRDGKETGETREGDKSAKEIKETTKSGREMMIERTRESNGKTITEIGWRGWGTKRDKGTQERG
jgi:hypothetical protein